MELSTNPSGGPIYTKGHTDRNSSSLASLSKPSRSSGKVLSSQFLVSSLETKFSSFQLTNTPHNPTHKHLSVPNRKPQQLYYTHSLSLPILLEMSLIILYSQACLGTIMILLRQLESLSLSLPSSHTKFFSLLVIMEPIIFIYSFTIKGSL